VRQVRLKVRSHRMQCAALRCLTVTRGAAHSAARLRCCELSLTRDALRFVRRLTVCCGNDATCRKPQRYTCIPCERTLMHHILVLSATDKRLHPYVPSHTLRSSSSANLYVFRTNLHFGSRSFYIAAPTVWNSLPSTLR